MGKKRKKKRKKKARKKKAKKVKKPGHAIPSQKSGNGLKKSSQSWIEEMISTEKWLISMKDLEKLKSKPDTWLTTEQNWKEKERDSPRKKKKRESGKKEKLLWSRETRK